MVAAQPFPPHGMTPFAAACLQDPPPGALPLIFSSQPAQTVVIAW